MNNRPYSADKTAQLNQPCAEYRALVERIDLAERVLADLDAVLTAAGYSESPDAPARGLFKYLVECQLSDDRKLMDQISALLLPAGKMQEQVSPSSDRQGAFRSAFLRLYRCRLRALLQSLSKPALQYVPASAEPPSGDEFWQRNPVPDGWGTQPVSPEAKDISSSYGLTERQAQNIVDFIDLVRAFDGDGGSNLLFDDTFGKLDDRQLKAVYVFALHLKLGTVSPLFFKQMTEALESTEPDEGHR